MRNDGNRTPRPAALLPALLTLVIGSVIGTTTAGADDSAPQPAPAAPTASAPADKAAAKPAAKPVDGNDDDQGADYEKNAARRFTPTERTPADKNVSFPVDI